MAASTGQQGPASGNKQTARENTQIERDREMILTSRAQGRGALFKTFVRLSGPGWLQSGITVGGVSFASSLYLGVLSGFTFLWLQPVAMVWGVAGGRPADRPAPAGGGNGSRRAQSHRAGPGKARDGR